MRGRTTAATLLLTVAAAASPGCRSTPADQSDDTPTPTAVAEPAPVEVDLQPDADGYLTATIRTEEEMAAVLERVVKSEMREGSHHNFAIFMIATGDNYYVQFEAEREGTAHLRGEAVSNQFLRLAHELDAEQMAALRRRGWSEPDAGMPNFHRQWSSPREASTHAAAAAEAIAVLREIYGLPEGDPIVVKMCLE